MRDTDIDVRQKSRASRFLRWVLRSTLVWNVVWVVLVVASAGAGFTLIAVWLAGDVALGILLGIGFVMRLSAGERKNRGK